MGQAPTFGQGLEVAGIVMKAIASAAKKSNLDSDKVQNKIVGNPRVIFDFFNGLFAEEPIKKEASSILKLLLVGENLTIEKLDGKRYIGKAKEVFKSYIDGDFKNWGLNNSGDVTGETAVQVYELNEDATFAKMFTSLSGDLDKLCLTQDQIIRFCEKYPTSLRQEGCATFFLFKMNGEYFVASVYVDSDGLRVCVRRFESDVLWGARYSPRVVVPQLVS